MVVQFVKVAVQTDQVIHVQLRIQREEALLIQARPPEVLIQQNLLHPTAC